MVTKFERAARTVKNEANTPQVIAPAGLSASSDASFTIAPMKSPTPARSRIPDIHPPTNTAQPIHAHVSFEPG